MSQKPSDAAADEIELPVEETPADVAAVVVAVVAVVAATVAAVDDDTGNAIITKPPLKVVKNTLNAQT